MRNKVVAGVLAILLGVFGVHRFYLGKIGLGILYLVLSVTGISALLGLIDGIVLLTMPEERFNAKYNKEYVGQDYMEREGRRSNRRKNRSERKERRSSASVKPRHKVKEAPKTKRDRAERAHRKVEFKKIYSKGKEYFKEYQFAEAEKTYLKALSLAPDHPKLLFDIACLYAMKEDATKGFEYLELAVSKGFKELDEIENNPTLAYLRIQDEFIDFAKAGYKKTYKKEDESNTELLEQLRQLDILKSRGLLTELEFEQEREKLIH